ncbi:mitochondrial 54S ribosomal protein YmL41 [Lecanora helva]
MASLNPVVTAAKTAVSKLPKKNPARRRKPSPLPLRPLEPERFRPPRGQKQVFLPNFTLTLLRPHPTQPPNMASFLTPLSLNKLDLKDYLYNLYNVEALRIRSYIAHGRTLRDQRTGQMYRERPVKKMTIEMAQGDNFVWPDPPEDLAPWEKGMQDAMKRDREEMEEGRGRRSGQGRVVLGEMGERERGGLRERARALLEGRVKWRPGWEQQGGLAPLGGEGRSSASV